MPFYLALDNVFEAAKEVNDYIERDKYNKTIKERQNEFSGYIAVDYLHCSIFSLSEKLKQDPRKPGQCLKATYPAPDR